MAAGQIVVFPPVFGTLPNASVAQLKQGLVVVDPNGLVKYNLPDDPYSTITMGWYEDQFPASGALYNFIATQLGYTAAQMNAFYVGLNAYPVRP